MAAKRPKIAAVPNEIRTYRIVGTEYIVRREDANYVGQSHSWVLLDGNERLVHRDFSREAVLFHYAEKIGV